MENKEQLIDAINCKYPHNNLIEIYYNTGRALPFTAQRFPDGRVSDWYRNQYVEVVKVVPRGKYGKYGTAYGFYYRNGERADSDENVPEQSWCKKTDTEPQAIPCDGCGSWMLIDILGEPTNDHQVKLLGIEDQITFGKYKGRTIKDLIESDWSYIKWAVIDSQNLLADVEQIINYHESIIRPLKSSDLITFGKYKGRTILDVYNEDSSYLKWLESKDKDFRIDWEELKSSK